MSRTHMKKSPLLRDRAMLKPQLGRGIGNAGDGHFSPRAETTEPNQHGDNQHVWYDDI